MLEDLTIGSERTLLLNIRSPHGADGIMAEVTAEDAVLTASLYGETQCRESARSKVFFKVISLPNDGVEIAMKLRAGVPVIVKLADVSRGLPLDESHRAVFESGCSGYGGGHGIDSMTIIHHKYQIP